MQETLTMRRRVQEVGPRGVASFAVACTWPATATGHCARCGAGPAASGTACEPLQRSSELRLHLLCLQGIQVPLQGLDVPLPEVRQLPPLQLEGLGKVLPRGRCGRSELLLHGRALCVRCPLRHLAELLPQRLGEGYKLLLEAFNMFHRMLSAKGSGDLLQRVIWTCSCLAPEPELGRCLQQSPCGLAAGSWPQAPRGGRGHAALRPELVCGPVRGIRDRECAHHKPPEV
mmetsp:Transcript_110168/g.341693  ORF Transcript_110168/g.341693 Transcript_110168/m.341693 type:complete len:230 (-) Transcript_110168:269-958(-)